MAIFNDIFCQICDRFYTKEQWNKHLYSSRHLHREVNGYWPSFFPQRKLFKDEGVKLEKAFWEVILSSNDNDLALFDFLKLYFRMCTNITDHVPIRYWDYYDDGNEEEQWGYGYRDDMIAQFKQDLYNKHFTLQDQGKMIQLILSIIELNSGLILLKNMVDQCLIMFMIMIITTKDWMELLEVQNIFLRLQNLKNY